MWRWDVCTDLPTCQCHFGRHKQSAVLKKNNRQGTYISRERRNLNFSNLQHLFQEISSEITKISFMPIFGLNKLQLSKLNKKAGYCQQNVRQR